MRSTRIAVWRGVAGIVLALAITTGCVTPADFEKVRRDVVDLKRGESSQGSNARVADIGTRLDALEAQLEQLQGRLEVSEHKSDEALVEARAARELASSQASAPVPQPGTVVGAAGAAPGAATAAAAGAVAGSATNAPGATPPGASASGELQAYRNAYAAWRNGDATTCIDRFREFLQTHPASGYADDAAYWMADCYFKKGDYKTAVLRFDDVVTKYPNGEKAADALYRQGESLLKLGPGYGKAAGKAFERVLKEYPNSARAPEAKKQLDLLGTG
jgi:tol-pal system protein YbgF